MNVETIRHLLNTEIELQEQLHDLTTLTNMLSAREVRKVSKEIGVGLILETIGLDAGNALLDAVKSAEAFRHVYPLLEQGKLDISSPLVEIALNMLVSAEVVTEENKDKLLALGIEPVTVNESDVKAAIWNDDGSMAITIIPS